MKISSSFNSPKRGQQQQSFKGIPENPKYIPEVIGNIGKLAGEYINTPEQKFFLALTALMFQPLIDLKFANDEQKNDAAIKSASKAIAGGITGVSIRAIFLKITDKYIGFDKNNKLNRYFFPRAAWDLQKQKPEIAKLDMNKYTKTLGTLFAVIFMILFSNSKMDVPLTNDIQDFISGIAKDNKTWLQSFADVGNNRSKKIKTWLNKKKEFFQKTYIKLKKIAAVIKEDTKIVKPKENSEWIILRLYFQIMS